jgi:hypothetical protein
MQLRYCVITAGETALVASVLGTSAAQQQLVPALMRVYGSADFVVGLDVDRDDYDKFTVCAAGMLAASPAASIYVQLHPLM